MHIETFVIIVITYVVDINISSDSMLEIFCDYH